MRSLALLALLVAAPSLAAEQKPKLAVLDLVANGASKELASAAGGVVASELDRLGVFKVVTSDAIRDMLAFEKQRQMLGCADSGCIAEIGGALGVDYLVSGKVTRLAASKDAPESFTLELTLSSVKRGQREGSVIETGRSEAELVGKTGRAVQKLVQKVLSGRTGTLVVASSEAGAVVKIDDQVKGTTPLQGQIALPAGPHALVVEKQGFVSFQKDVQIQPGKLTDERATLVPSPDFIRDYESRQRKVRLGAWISTGVAVAGVAGAVLLQADATRVYGTDSTPGTFLYARRKLLDGQEIDPVTGVDYRAQAAALKSKVSQRETFSYVAAGVGGAAAVTATWLWIAGDDPGRYARYRDVATRLDVVPLPGGALASLTVGF
jgi:PEGA domain-containing protein